MSLFIPITKVDALKRLVYGTVTEEVPDKAGEILDYESAKPAFVEWSQQFENASGGKSLGNVRAMHGAVAAGKFTDISFDDDNKRICGVAKIIDDDEWEKVLEGVYTGFSIGGGYARRWPDANNPQLMRYTPVLHEVSLVDNPAVPTATFDVIKQDGTIECRKFALPHQVLTAAVDALQKRIEKLEKQSLPYKGAPRVVNKSDDYALPEEKLAKLPDKDRVHELMKIALANPIIL
jgi:hypothetical protein